MNPAFSKTNVDRDKSVGDMINELQIMRAGIRHPNIVRYHKTFLQSKYVIHGFLWVYTHKTQYLQKGSISFSLSMWLSVCQHKLLQA